MHAAGNGYGTKNGKLCDDVRITVEDYKSILHTGVS
jgi:hypothetical protein